VFTLVWTSWFARAAKKFVKRHPELREKFAAILRDLEKDPFQPHLKFHHLGGRIKGIQAVSITDKYRVTLDVIITDREVILLDVGSHNDVYRQS
jgi:mRNA-degrading endonuclease YafQ of YafQ-DinJ toxin-antitoxin module